MSNNRNSDMFRKLMGKKLGDRTSIGEQAPEEQQPVDRGYQSAEDIDSSTPADGGYQTADNADNMFNDTPAVDEDQLVDDAVSNIPADGGYQTTDNADIMVNATPEANEDQSVDDANNSIPPDRGYHSASDQFDHQVVGSPPPKINIPTTAPPAPDKSENLSAPSSPTADRVSLSVTPLLKRKGQKDAYIAPNKSYDTEILEQNGFTQRIDIKSGVTGTIGHYCYVGENKNLQAFAAASDNFVLVKIKATDEERATRARADSNANRIALEKIHASQTYDNEKSLTDDLAKNQSATRAALMTVTLIGNIAGIERKTTVIVTEPIYYNKTQLDQDMKDIEAKIPKQEKTIKEIEEKLGRELDPEELYRRQIKLDYAKGAIPRLISAAVKGSMKNSQDYMEELGKNKDESPAIQFKTVFATAFQAQTQLHKDGLLHLDTQPRNFVVQMIDNLPNARVIDFGASRKCDENGVALSNKPFPLDPVYFYNQEALNLGARPPKYTVQTDIFSFRMFMIESLAFYAHANKADIDHMHINGLQQPAQTNQANYGGKPRDVDILAANDDMTRIHNTLANLEKYLQGRELIDALSGSHNNSIHYTREGIATYQAYLTSPIPQGNKEEVIQQNQRAFSASAQPAAIPEPSEQHTKLIIALSHIKSIVDRYQKFDALIQLVAKNPVAIGAYSDQAKNFILYKAKEFAVDTASQNKEGHEEYTKMANIIDDIIRSSGTDDQKFKQFCEYANKNYASKANAKTEDSNLSMQFKH